MKEHLFIILIFLSVSVFSQDNNKLKTSIFALNGNQITKKIEGTVSTKERISIPNQSINLVNFNPSLSFQGVHQGQLLPINIDGLRKMTLFTVYQSFAEEEMMIWKNSIDGRKTFLSTAQMLGPAGRNSFESKQLGVPTISTVTQFWGNTGRGSATANLILGGSEEHKDSIAPFFGNIPEILIFKETFSNEAREQIETYLAIKYGVTLKNTHYRNTNNDIIWNYRENNEFAYRIAGIGRDTAIGLMQNKSNSTNIDVHLQVEIPTLETFDNQQFIIWSDNNASFVLKEKGNDEQELEYLERQWKINPIPNEKSLPSTIIKLDFKTLNLPIDYRPYIVIRQTENASKKKVIKASPIKRGHVAYFNIEKWDEDGSGSDYFTFAFKPQTLPVKSIRAYPNPSESLVNFDINLKDVSFLQLSIFDELGRTIFTNEQTGQKNYQFQKEFTKNGTYRVFIKTKFGRLTKDFIILKE